MSYVRIGSPVCLPVDLADAKQNLRIDGDECDSQISNWIAGITAELEHEIGQCVMQQTLQVILPRFDTAIELPHPAIAVTKIEYYDQQGIARELDPATTRIVRTRYESRLVLARGVAGPWPDTDGSMDAVVITVDSGYGDTPAATPDAVKLYILAKLVDQFDPVTMAEKATPQSAFIDRLLDGCRSYQ
jgi:uncharacterized phiE125 gp8 family phage protein